MSEIKNQTFSIFFCYKPFIVENAPSKSLRWGISVFFGLLYQMIKAEAN